MTEHHLGPLISLLSITYVHLGKFSSILASNFYYMLNIVNFEFFIYKLKKCLLNIT